MFQWAKDLKESSTLTKNALIALIIWAAPVVIMTIYCYARLDFISNDEYPKSQEQPISK